MIGKDQQEGYEDSLLRLLLGLNGFNDFCLGCGEGMFFSWKVEVTWMVEKTKLTFNSSYIPQECPKRPSTFSFYNKYSTYITPPPTKKIQLTNTGPFGLMV